MKVKSGARSLLRPGAEEFVTRGRHAQREWFLPLGVYK